MTEPSSLPENCPLCGSADAAPYYAKYGYALVRCLICQAIYVHPMPSAAELQAHYQQAAYFEGANDQGYLNYADMQKALRPHFQRRVQIVERHVPARGYLLDFGCAAGYFLEMAQTHGWQIAGVELSHQMAQRAAQRVKTPIYPALDELPNRNFAAITLWEVIEHVANPIELLRQLYARLKPGGLLMLSTPNTGHWQAVRAKDLWVSYRPPSHLQYFTRSTLNTALRQAGFDRVEISGVSPLPPLPGWLHHMARPLEQSLATGQARPWRLALLTWRGIRMLGWGWQKIAHSHDDIFATLEALAFRPT